MLRLVASFFTSNTKPTDNLTNTQENENSQVDNITTIKTDEDNISLTETAEHSNDNDIDISNETIPEEELSEEDFTLLQSLRKQKQQELTQKTLLRRITHQAVMDYYAQDYIPLSQLQEKLEEDNLPLVLLQEKLKQRGGISTYTTTRENINFLLNNQSLLHKLLTRSKKSKSASTTLTTDNGDAPPPKDIRDYDVWDDAIIGHLMNLIDTIGMETIKEETSEEIVKEDAPRAEKGSKEVDKEVEKESSDVVKESSDVAKESNDVAKESNDVAKESNDVVVKEPNDVGKEAEKESRKIGKESEEVGKGIKKEVETGSKEVVKESKKARKVLRESKEVVRGSKAVKESKEVVKGAVKGAVKEIFINKSPSASIYNFSEESTEDLIYREDEDQEATVAAIENNTVRKKINSKSITIAEEIINFGETINVAESLVLSSNRSSLRNKRSQRSHTKTDSGYGENSISTNSTKDVKRENRSFGKSRSMFSIGQFFPPSSTNSNLNRKSSTSSNLNRKSSIHSRKSYENDISRRSSVSSKFSINTIDVVMEEPNEDGFENTKFRNKFSAESKRSSLAQKSSNNNKSLHFLKNIWKSNPNLSSADGGENFLSNNEFMERYQQQGDRELNHHANLRRSYTTPEITGDTGYSNFYLSMPNGKWMVRTRTASRKITGTQYVEKEYI